MSCASRGGELFELDLPFFLRMRWTPVRGSTLSFTVQYEPLPRSVSGRGTFSKHGFRERLWRTEFCRSMTMSHPTKNTR